MAGRGAGGSEVKSILCVPFAPVHDVGIKLIRNALAERGHRTELLSPDLPAEEVVRRAAAEPWDFILVSRTLGYGVAELLARFVDLLDAAGVRERSKIVIGGKPVTPELAAELGFDRGFGEHSTIDEVVAYVEGRGSAHDAVAVARTKPDVTAGFGYQVHHPRVADLLATITGRPRAWAEGRTTPAVRRARLREEILAAPEAGWARLWAAYHGLSDEPIVAGNRDGLFPKGVRRVRDGEVRSLRALLAERGPVGARGVRHAGPKPLLFKFLGSGCPVMDLFHAKVCERYGMDGFLIINPSWEARYEGLLDGLLTHENDGTITSVQNIRLMRELLDPATVLTVRAHRGLNTPETVLLAARGGADLTKINLVYGSLGAGTAPERLAVDGLEAMRIAARHGMGFDIPGNDELSGVPAWKTLAGLLVTAHLGHALGARPILKPLFCYGPHIVLHGLMADNMVDYNLAKVRSLRSLMDAPIWPGEPIAFMTQTEDRVQSANATSYHAGLAATAGVEAITLASTDEAYSRGPISLAARIAAIRAVADGYRFVGGARFQPTAEVDRFTARITDGIVATLEDVARHESLPHAILAGALGNAEDGAYPGTFGRGSVTLDGG
ncbi:MAG: cobalamin B12-binding domain-containing protein [Gemmatimonadetes bacterium]|nr:cobalamin B12-binding domain-containing protein [Gemmatimonadota bacterium]